MKQDLLYRGTYRIKPDTINGNTLTVSNSWDYYNVTDSYTLTAISGGLIGTQMLFCFENSVIATNSPSLILPNNEDLSIAAGDILRFVKTEEGVWKFVGGYANSLSSSISDEAFASDWDGVTKVGASKNVLYDEISSKAYSGTNYDIEMLRNMTGNGSQVIIGNSETSTVATEGNYSVLIGNGVCGSSIMHSYNVIIGQNTVDGDYAAHANVILGSETAKNGTFQKSIVVGSLSCNTSTSGVDCSEIGWGIYIGAEVSPGDADPIYEIVIGYQGQGRGDYTTTIGHPYTNVTYLYGALNLEHIGQIKFPATQDASDDATTLDDYEEGTWTPSLAFNEAAVGMTYTKRLGKYTKIGNVVNFEMDIELLTKGTSQGTTEIFGLPFAVSDAGLHTACTCWGERIITTESMVCYLRSDASSLRIGKMRSADSIYRYIHSDLVDTTKIVITGSYLT